MCVFLKKKIRQTTSTCDVASGNSARTSRTCHVARVQLSAASAHVNRVTQKKPIVQRNMSISVICASRFHIADNVCRPTLYNAVIGEWRVSMLFT